MMAVLEVKVDVETLKGAIRAGVLAGPLTLSLLVRLQEQGYSGASGRSHRLLQASGCSRDC